MARQRYPHPLGTGGVEGDDSGSLIMSDPSMLLAHVKEMKQERDKANSKYEQVTCSHILH